MDDAASFDIMDVNTILISLPLFIVVGAIWGLTNALLHKYNWTNDVYISNNFAKRLITIFIKNWKFFIIFICNQSGSIFYYLLLIELPLTIVVPCVNSLTFLFTIVGDKFFSNDDYDRKEHWSVYLGAILVCCGLCICLLDSY
uniref:Transmembrane protein 234 n=1 Tax=Romanomermis culicivorax TaxID=13658 RepID=A0A915J1S1_ROMCU